MCWSNRPAGHFFFGLSAPPEDFVPLFGEPFFEPFLSPSLVVLAELALELLEPVSDEVPVLELLLSLALDFDSLFFSFFELSLEEDSTGESLLVATFFLSPDLKSVSYHPPPFKRNATAEIFFLSRSLPHEGH
jgi:hypothetical protein